MKSMKQILTESNDSLTLFKRLIDQNYKTPEEKMGALVTVADMIIGRANFPKLVKALSSPPPLPMKDTGANSATVTQQTNVAPSLANL